MKHVVVYIFIIIVCLFMVILINKNQETQSVKLLTVDTYYSFVDETDSYIYLDFYLNTNNHPMVDQESYQSLMIHSQDQSKSMNLALTDVLFQHQETYLNDLYFKYTYKIESPLLGYDFDISDCYLTVELNNDETYALYMGSISLKTIYEDDFTHLDWQGLSGSKQDQSYLSRLKQIDIDYTRLSEDIKSIHVGDLYHVSYEVLEDEIIIDIPYMKQLFYACPIIITFEDHSIYVIDYFVYIKDYEILKQSGQLIYHYALN